jgi:hypothetical protein
MSLRRHRSATVIALLACCGAVAGCGGSSPSTSRSDVATVAAAETALIKRWNEATEKGKGRCEPSAEKAFDRCYRSVAVPEQAAAAKRFISAIEMVKADGVGKKCEDALDEALATITSISSFPGGTTSECRADSRGE